MNLTFHDPPESLRPFLRRFIVSDYDVVRPLTVSPWATGNIYLIYFFGELSNYAVTVNRRAHPFTFPAWLAGQIEYHDVRITISQRTSAVVGEFTAQGFWRLFGKPGRWITGRTCQIADLGDPHGAHAEDAFSCAPRDPHEALARMISFLERAVDGAGPSDPLLDGVLSALEENHGRMSVGELASAAGVTQRHLTRRFSEVVGLAPKFYGRVLQINQVIEMLFLPGARKLADVAQDAGFYDQAHLNRAMMLFFQEGPSAFLKSDTTLFRTFLEQLPPPGGRG